MRLTSLVTLLALGCTSDYGLNRHQDGGIAPEDVNIPQYSLQELEEDNPKVSYDPCDSSDEGWELNPVGSDKNSCYGVLGEFSRSEDSGICTWIDYSACFENYGNSYFNSTDKDNVGTIHYSLNPWNCDTNDKIVRFCWDAEHVDSTQGLELDAMIWLFSNEEITEIEATSGYNGAQALYHQVTDNDVSHEALFFQGYCNVNHDCSGWLHK